MIMNSFFSRLRACLRDFRSARGANVTVTFALATIPIIGAVGAAVDYSHVNSARTAMQAATDATALMLSKTADTMTSSQLNTKATSVFTGLYTRTEVTGILVTPTYTTTGGSQVVVQAQGTVKASFVSLIGISTVQIGATSTVRWGNTKLRVALVLDNTGSMDDDGKITALKTATKNLLTQLQNASTVAGDVYVSIIPFAKEVNLGASNYNQNWIDWTDWDEVNGSCSKSGSTTKTSCTGQGNCSLSGNNSQSSCTSAGTCSLSGNNSQSSCVADGECNNPGQTTPSSCTSQRACSNASYTSNSSCTSHGYSWRYGTWTTGVWTPGVWTPATWTARNHNTWTGCVEDRGLSNGPSSGNYDTNVTAPTTSNVDTLYPADQYSDCPQAVMGLNYNWTSMTTLVNAMSPGGNTNQGIGLQIGWMSLVGGGPFTVPAMDDRYTYKQIIILLTDGLNTQNRWYSNQTSIDTREAMTCANVKAAGITLYTVQVNTGGDPLSTLLQQCASDTSKFFHLTNANSIVATFSQIGVQLSNLRVAK